MGTWRDLLVTSGDGWPTLGLECEARQAEVRREFAHGTQQ